MRLSRRLMPLGFICCLSVPLLAATPSWAEVECGDTIGPDEVAVLTRNLTCNSGEWALSIIGPNAVLKLGGHTVTCENIVTGIRLQGSRAVLVGGLFKNATVTGCNVGIVMEEGGHHFVKKVTATANSGPGFWFLSPDNAVSYTISKQNMRGYEVGITGLRTTLRYNRAEDNTVQGFIVFTNDTTLIKNQAISNNTNNGFLINGNGHILKWNVSKENGDNGDDNGFRINGDNNQLIGNHASGNRGSGFLLFLGATGNFMTGNITRKNQENGIRVREVATGSTVVGNIATGNTLADLRDDNENCDENTWKANWFRTSQTNPPDAGCIR